MPKSLSGSKSRSIHHGNLKSKKGHISKPPSRFSESPMKSTQVSNTRVRKAPKPTKTDAAWILDEPQVYDVEKVEENVPDINVELLRLCIQLFPID